MWQIYLQMLQFTDLQFVDYIFVAICGLSYFLRTENFRQYIICLLKLNILSFKLMTTFGFWESFETE
jgi:hypothetical protein